MNIHIYYQFFLAYSLVEKIEQTLKLLLQIVHLLLQSLRSDKVFKEVAEKQAK